MRNILFTLMICASANAQDIKMQELKGEMKVSGEEIPFYILSGQATVSETSIPMGRKVYVYPVKGASLMENGTSFVSVLDKVLQDKDSNIGFKLGETPVTLMKLEKGKVVVWGVDYVPIKKPKPVVKTTALKNVKTIIGKGNISYSGSNWSYKQKGLKKKKYTYSFDIVEVKGSGKLQVGNGFKKLIDKKYGKRNIKGTFTVSKYDSFVIGADKGTTYKITNLKVY